MKFVCALCKKEKDDGLDKDEYEEGMAQALEELGADSPEDLIAVCPECDVLVQEFYGANGGKRH